jgi:hypothetical protein
MVDAAAEVKTTGGVLPDSGRTMNKAEALVAGAAFSLYPYKSAIFWLP